MMRWGFVHILSLLFLLSGCATYGDSYVREGDSAGKEVARSGSKKKKKKKNKKAKKSQALGIKDDKSVKGPSTNVPKAYSKRKTACSKYSSTIAEVAKKYNLEPELVMGVVKVESSFNPKCKSRVGAAGMMQVMPRTGKHMKCDSDLHDPEINIDCGCRVLRRYLDLYDGNVIYALSAYNAGPGNANPSAKGRYLPFNFKYVEKVLRWRNVFVRFGCH
jgi:soluble lytic murein transglycosylase-like protein